MNSNKLSRGIIIIFISNVINMGFKIFVNFLQPKLLSVETYALIQTYTLYVSYAAILHFGFIDGMYLEYGGKNLNNINVEKLNKNIATLRTFQLVITLICLIVSFSLKNKMLILVTATIIPANLSAYFRMLFQAIGEYDKYGKIMNIHSGLLFLSNFFLLFLIQSDNYIYYIAANIIVYTVVWLILEYVFFKMFKKTYHWFSFDLVQLSNDIKEGLPLTIGNLASTFLFSLDRWFVKFFLKAADFAYYSFAISIQTFLNIAITPVTITLYNYFCYQRKDDEIKLIKNFLLIFSTFIVAAAFPVRFILETFIKEYVEAINIVFLLFASKIFDIVIQGLFVNMYKAKRKQRLYLCRLLLAILIGFLINIVCHLLYNTNLSYSIGTLITIIIWFVISSNDIKEAGITFKDFIYLTIAAIALVTIGFVFKSFLGIVLYIIVVSIFNLLFYKNDFIRILLIAGGRILQILKVRE